MYLHCDNGLPDMGLFVNRLFLNHTSCSCLIVIVLLKWKMVWLYVFVYFCHVVCASINWIPYRDDIQGT